MRLIFFICIAFYSFAWGDESWLKNANIKQQYEAYLTVDNHKAFAQERNYAYWSSNEISAKHAIETALLECLKENTNSLHCTVINVDGKWEKYTLADLCKLNNLTPDYYASGDIRIESCISGRIIAALDFDGQDAVTLDGARVSHVSVKGNASVTLSGNAYISYLNVYDNATINIGERAKISHVTLHGKSHADVYSDNIFLNVFDSASANIYKVKGFLFSPDSSINLYANHVYFKNGKLLGSYRDGTPFSIELSKKEETYTTPSVFPEQITIHKITGASFDCAKASSKVEKLICSDEKLSELDLETAYLFKRAFTDMIDQSRIALKNLQNSWLKTRNICKDKKCIEEAYEKRILELKEEFGEYGNTLKYESKSAAYINKFPFVPYISYSSDNELCGKILDKSKKQFFSVKNDRKIDMEYSSWEKVYEDLYSLNRFVMIEKIDLNFNKTMPLVQWIIPHSWRGDNYKVELYSSNEYFDDLVQNNSADLRKIYDSFNDAEIYPNFNITNGNDLNISIHGSDWEKLDIFEYKNGYYFFGWLNPIVTLKILDEGVTEAVCVIVMEQKRDNALLASENFTKLNAVLLNMTGSSDGCGGTLDSLGEILHNRIPSVLNKIIHVPWKESLYPYRDENIDFTLQLIEQWGYEGLWNYEVYKRYLDSKDGAYNDLAKYYKKEFGINDKSAKELASRSFVELLSAYFNAHGYSINPKSYDYLRKSLLLGKSVGDIEKMLTGDWIKPVNEYNHTEIDEPTLFFSLRYPELVKLLLKKGADINTTNVFGKTALMYAAQFNLYDTAKTLLDNGIDVNAPTYYVPEGRCGYNIQVRNVSALHYAARYADAKFVKLLLDNGADKDIKDSNEKTPFDWIELYKDENLNFEKDLDTLKKLLKPNE
ncbi:MAG: ankyrin repeat domain-containing protein [Campylobacteraceae bacterium]|jgi:uncharacterized protein YecT (DUF1311 family)|nr:ankyrin repeat domain-containing protein [Campylobacteraceae bacterium]